VNYIGVVSRESSAARPSWLNLVRTSAAAGDGCEGLAQVVGEGSGGGDGLPSGLKLDGAVLAGCRGEFADEPACLRLDPAADGKDGEDDGEVGIDGVPLAVGDGLGLRVRL
jgi:hypothetical protein